MIGEKREHGGDCDCCHIDAIWVMDIGNARRGTLALLIHRENENMRAKERDRMQGAGPDVSALISKQSGSVPQKSLMRFYSLPARRSGHLATPRMAN